MPIRAGVVRDALMATGVALFHVSTEYRRAAHRIRRSEVLRGRRWGLGCDGAREPIKRTPRRTHLDRGNPEIARGGRQTAMAEEQLNGADGGAGFKELDGKCVAQQMR